MKCEIVYCYICMNDNVNNTQLYRKYNHKLMQVNLQMCVCVHTGSVLFVYWKEDVWYRVTVTELFQKECFQSVTKCLASEVSRLRVHFQDFGFSKCFSVPR